MTTKWFLDDLGVSEGATEQDIRNAYRERLAQLGSTASSATISLLEETFRQALAWRACGDSSTQETALNVQKTADHFYRQLLECMACGQSVEDLFPRQRTRARSTGPEVALALEGRLLDRLIRAQGISRPLLFDAACRHWHWHDPEHARQLGASGAWIGHVLAQEQAWQAAQETLPPAVKLLPLLETCRGTAVPAATLPQWPRMRQIILAYPQYLSLRIEPSCFQAWDKAYRDHVEAAHAMASVSAPAVPPSTIPAVPVIPATALRTPTTQAVRAPWLAWITRQRDVLVVGTAALCVMLYLVSRMAAPADRSVRPGYAAPSASLVLILPEQSSTTRENCDYINLVVHQPSWEPPADADQRRRYANAIDGCMKVNHWHAHATPDSALERLGVHA
ncbi:hypothetical protein [Dyella sp.]|uniref:hypothetical protein n=1 Tax=Dyella sp. TaxID=1869338 RepID=UPI002ED2D200